MQLVDNIIVVFCTICVYFCALSALKNFILWAFYILQDFNAPLLRHFYVFCRNFFVRADKVLKLRKLLDKLSDVEGLMTEEKDPEEFLSCLLQQVLKTDPYLHFRCVNLPLPGPPGCKLTPTKNMCENCSQDILKKAFI